jgi:EAL domain-containing protein (putative c-di-GMP-specific phosphodiesterase class I)
LVTWPATGSWSSWPGGWRDAWPPCRPRRGGCLLSRLGGDEFAVLAEEMGAEQVVHLAGEIEHVTRRPFLLERREVYTTVSIGIVISDGAYERAEDVIRDADLAMYRAKESGKARYELFDASLHVRALARLELETDVRNALDRRELVVHYQPKVRLSTGAVTGFEALLRWQHPRHGLLGPSDFIPVAEDTGMILPIGEWVLLETCGQLRAWQDRFPSQPPLTMSVNLSAKQLTQPDLVQRVEWVIRSTGIPPQSLRLEITETLLMRDPEAAAEMLRRLKRLQVGLMLDDFGTGYSSLNYLHKFPFDTLKIDQSFVMSMHERDESREIIRTILSLAQTLQMGVVAEGVETATQVTDLIAMGCEHGQGYLFSMPVDAPVAERLLAGRAE